MIYMDNSATSPVKEEVFNAMVPYLKEEFGNPVELSCELLGVSRAAAADFTYIGSVPGRKALKEE